MATLPPSLRRLLHVSTAPGQDVTVDPAQDPAGYQQLLLQSSDERLRRQRAEEDAAALITDPRYPQQEAARSFNRAREDAAMGPGGYNRAWQPFLESLKVMGDTAGAPVKVDARGLDLLDDRDRSGFPVASTRRPPSLAALAKQGGL